MSVATIDRFPAFVLTRGIWDASCVKKPTTEKDLIQSRLCHNQLRSFIDIY